MGGEQGEEVSIWVFLESSFGAMNCSMRQLLRLLFTLRHAKDSW
jgi:hypothetical protein